MLINSNISSLANRTSLLGSESAQQSNNSLAANASAKLSSGLKVSSGLSNGSVGVNNSFISSELAQASSMFQTVQGQRVSELAGGAKAIYAAAIEELIKEGSGGGNDQKFPIRAIYSVPPEDIMAVSQVNTGSAIGMNVRNLQAGLSNLTNTSFLGGERGNSALLQNTAQGVNTAYANPTQAPINVLKLLS